MALDSKMLHAKPVKILPHIVDTVLLISALTLAYKISSTPIQTDWIIAKVIALVIYIGVGVVALKPGGYKPVRIAFWILGIIIFIYIASVAIHKSVYGLLYFLYL